MPQFRPESPTGGRWYDQRHNRQLVGCPRRPSRSSRNKRTPRIKLLPLRSPRQLLAEIRCRLSSSPDFWDGDEPGVAWLILHPFASKEYVQRHMQPIRDRVNELDELTASNTKDDPGRRYPRPARHSAGFGENQSWPMSTRRRRQQGSNGQADRSRPEHPRLRRRNRRR